MSLVTITHPDLPDSRQTVDSGTFRKVLAARGWQEVDTSAEPDPRSDYTAGEQPAPADYTGLLKADLEAEAEQRGLETSGTKADLIERLQAADVEQSEQTGEVL